MYVRKYNLIATLAWGVNFPAHLVIVKGTEYFDAKTKGYVDYPITDVLQMMGRAGRIQYSDRGVARIFVLDRKKDFYKKFLHEPFPVESSLHKCLHDHLNAEIVSGTITNTNDIIEFLSCTYLYRRLAMVNIYYLILKNPTYYGAIDTSEITVSKFLKTLIDEALRELQESDCITKDETDVISSTEFGRIASFYYLKHKTIKMLKTTLVSGYSEENDFVELLRILCNTVEYSELPVRHNEDIMNRSIEKDLPVPLNQQPTTSFSSKARQDYPVQVDYESPHCKAFLLLQAHMVQLENLPCSDYITDTNSVLDQAIRILQAMIDICVVKKHLHTAIGVMKLVQCIRQGRWVTDSSLTCLPHFSLDKIPLKYKGKLIETLREICQYSGKDLDAVLSSFSDSEKTDICRVLSKIPKYEIDVKIKDAMEKDGCWVLDASQKYEIRLSFKNQLVKPSKIIYTPRFPKPVAEGWWVMFAKEDQVLELKRLSPFANSTDMLCFFRIISPAESGIYKYTVHFISDGYMGIDQKVDIIWHQ